MLQEAVDSLFDNGRRGRPVTGTWQPPAEVPVRHAEGQAGPVPSEPARHARRLQRSLRHRGRSAAQAAPVRVCPSRLALELFKPFVMKRLLTSTTAQNIKSAKRMVERARPVVWDVLEEVITEQPGSAEPGADAAPPRHPGLRTAAGLRARRSRSTRWSAPRSTRTSTATRWRYTCRCPPRRRPRRGS